MSSSLFYLTLGFTDDASCLVSKAIRAVTGGPSHALVLVTEIKPGGHAERYYFESIGKVDKSTHKSGMRGPIPLAHLVGWVAEKKSRSFVTVPDVGYLPLSQEEAAAAVANLRDAVPVIHYARSQIVRNFVAATIKTRLTFGDGSPLAWTCCEAPIRCAVFPARWAFCVDLRDVNADEMWPGGPSRYSLMAAAQRVVREFGTISV